jgi:putative transcriptional regulator
MLKTKIKELREQAGYSQSYIGSVLSLPQSKVSNIERGRRHVKLEEAVKLADTFKVKLDELIEKR